MSDAAPHRPVVQYAAAPPGAPAGPPLFVNRNFILLWLAYGISAFGDHVSRMALLKMQDALDPGVTDVTRRIAIMLFAFMTPFFLLGPVFGWLADRLPRRALMITADLVRAVVIFEMFSILMGVNTWLGRDAQAPISVGVAILPLAMLGTFAAMFSPARLALLPTLVQPGQLIRANACTAGLGMIASIASFYIGALLVERVGVRANFVVNSLTFLASAAFVYLIRPPATAHAPAHAASDTRAAAAPGDKGLRAIADAFRYVRCHRRVMEVIFVSVVFWAGSSIVHSIIPALVKDFFGGTYEQIGIYQGLLGVGLLVGSLVITLLGAALKSELAISWCLKLTGLAGLFLTGVIVLGLGRIAGAAAILLIGFFGSGIGVSVNALLQRIVPNSHRGRVFGVNDMFSMAGLLAATGALGIPSWPNIDRHVAWITTSVSLGLIGAGLWTTYVRLARGRFGRALTFWRNLNEFYCRSMARVRRIGVCTIPVEGPVIIAANHNSVLDPFVLTTGSPNRSIGYMIAREYAVMPGFAGLVRSIDCVPVSRSGTDIASVKAALRHLADGKALGIFPSGRIVPRDASPEPREGVGMLALRSGATVIPAYIGGLRPALLWTRGTAAQRSRWVNLLDLLSMVVPFFQLHRATVRFGPPVDLTEFAGREKDREAHAAASQKIMDAVLALREEAEGGVGK
jgi:1-acyl-sn-glycerol-3-phosphate acyltransferase